MSLMHIWSCLHSWNQYSARLSKKTFADHKCNDNQQPEWREMTVSPVSMFDKLIRSPCRWSKFHILHRLSLDAIFMSCRSVFLRRRHSKNFPVKIWRVAELKRNRLVKASEMLRAKYFFFLLCVSSKDFKDNIGKSKSKLICFTNNITVSPREISQTRVTNYHQQKSQITSSYSKSTRLNFSCCWRDNKSVWCSQLRQECVL